MPVTVRWSRNCRIDRAEPLICGERGIGHGLARVAYPASNAPLASRAWAVRLRGIPRQANGSSGWKTS